MVRGVEADFMGEANTATEGARGVQREIEQVRIARGSGAAVTRGPAP